jgi:succinate dehydrogenase/fumarate reductase flavoprotein subunit
VTLRYEGTVRGVGGLAVDTGCATNIAGLFAAGDAASRGQFVGATSGGGGPNATWAIASGVWSGRSAARFAAHVGSSFAKRRARGIGRAGLRSTELSKGDLSLAEIVSAVKREILPIDRSFFRSRENLSNASSRLDSLWGRIQGTPHSARSREVAALIAVGRLITSSATIREETRGIQRRVDFRETDPRLEHHLICGGLENVWVRSTNPPAGLS